MKNKKLIIVFMLVITFLALMVNFTKATDDVGQQLPTIESGNNPSNQNSPTTNAPAPITNNPVTHYHKQVWQVIQPYSYLLAFVQFQQYMHILELENITISINSKENKEC